MEKVPLLIDSSKWQVNCILEQKSNIIFLYNIIIAFGINLWAVVWTWILINY